MDTFGSLSAAFEELDQHDREEITRSQWDAALNARGWNTEAGEWGLGLVGGEGLGLIWFDVYGDSGC